jgi:hypothetical protein
MMMLNRVVCLPDFQGIGIASRMMDVIAQHFVDKKQRVVITTSHPGMIANLKKNDRWHCGRQGRASRHHGVLKGMGSGGRITTSCEFR